MSRFGFRIRTVLIIFAVLAVVMGALKFLAHHFGVAVASVAIDRSNLEISLDLKPGQWDTDIRGPGNLTVDHHIRFYFPLTAILILIALVIALAALASYVRLKFRRTRNP